MEINGFTYVRNGFKMGYPFIPSIQSLLPIVSKMIVVVGDSDDGTREAIINLSNRKIVIIDSIWDEGKRKSGEIFKEQSDLGIKNITGDWCIHLQADEVIKESSLSILQDNIHFAEEFDKVDGLLFPFYHFWGDYNHIRNTRRTHAFEIRAFKNHRNVRSYRDSQGFRKIRTSHPDKKEIKLKVLKTDIPIVLS
jgi:glycosyltransferase involved in cell wall biosynthesis